MNPPLPLLIEQSLSTSDRWIVLSPHLDDAVLSCGALLAAQASKREVVVTTLFTECCPHPHTRAARSYLRQCSATDAESLFEARRREDVDVLTGLGVRFLHVGETDALFRQREQGLPGGSFITQAFPELLYRYPTYRFDIALGRVSRGDSGLIRRLQSKLGGLVDDYAPGLVFSPLGVGNHVDHLITRTVGAQLCTGSVFYSEYPYNLHHRPDSTFLRKRDLVRWEWTEGIEIKQHWVRRYKTQAEALFPSGVMPTVPETYYA